MAVWAELNGLNCHKCTRQSKALRSCDKDGPEIELEGFKITRCAASYADTMARYCISAYSHYKSGFLMCSGGTQDQPAKMMEAIQVIGGLIERLREKEK